MNYYKELSEALHICYRHRNGNEALENLLAAADAIEKLVEERDAALKEIDNLNAIIKNLRYKYRNVDETDIWRCNKKAL